eukprot:CAMPEP_0174917488 /NCGR_PEP_ID=MMETSP1355-20121228/2492_1 /TAXON_ID=464990 /ORGANISM="Hemiselmis tepida, Strain CCMP443" /LENGTH=96 /DNA_ID=CAMNT_0016162589 /DNA_START=65 /DNA_END=352 /DNA_ORIENTATION=-
MADSVAIAGNPEGKAITVLKGHVTNGSRDHLFMQSSVGGPSDVFIPSPVCNTLAVPLRVNDLLTVEAIENRKGKNSYKALKVVTVNGRPTSFAGDR